MKDFDALQKRRTIKKILESDEDAKTIEAAVNRINGQLQNFQVHFDLFLCSAA
jgi:arginyl-tRNA synthetase